MCPKTLAKSRLFLRVRAVNSALNGDDLQCLIQGFVNMKLVFSLGEIGQIVAQNINVPKYTNSSQ